MNAQVQIRPVLPEEWPIVSRLMLDTYVGDGFVDPETPYVEDLTDVEGRAAEAVLLVALQDEQVVGTVTFCLPETPWAEIARDEEAEFRMLAVEPSARGRGVGRRLVQECLDRARASGARRLVISTTPRMTSAHRLYESMGFLRWPDRDWSPTPEVDLWVYAVGLGR